MSTTTEAQGESLAERLVPIACDLVCRVRDEGRDSIAQLLASLADEERSALPVVLAAMVPTDRGVHDLLAWVTWDEPGASDPAPEALTDAAGIQPCGTRAAFMRHKKRDEPPCVPCRQAERAYQRARRRPRQRQEVAA